MSNSRSFAPIAVLRPRLPDVEAVLPWLRRMDEARVYSNFGPLSQEFSRRLCGHYALAEGCVIPVANATLGLAAVLMALEVKPGTLCAMPAFTFVATAHAAIAAGMVPWLLDVDEDHWQLTPEGVERALASAPGEVGAVIPVCPFGQPVDGAAWLRFRERSGVQVIIDAAAAFDGVRPGPLPAVVSLHATKAMGIGEGGLVVSSDPKLSSRVQRRINFGFLGTREAGCIALNAKMSEVQAAYGLAALAQWPETRAGFARVQDGLRHRLEEHGLPSPAGIGEEWVSSTFCLRLPADAAEVSGGLAAMGLETRRWWGDGLHRHAAFASCPRQPLPVTDRLATGVLGLPCWLDLGEAELSRIASAVAGLCGGGVGRT